MYFALGSTRNRSLRLKPVLRQTPELTKKPPVVEKPSPAHSYLDNLGARVTRFKAQHIAAGTYLYKLGMDNSFKTYVNQYSSNPTALNKTQKNEERDKKRYMSHKFSLTGPGEYKWCGQIFGMYPIYRIYLIFPVLISLYFYVIFRRSVNIDKYCQTNYYFTRQLVTIIVDAYQLVSVA